ncbi:hypothetical protein ILUMI_26812 [Ignelater luminosus]|uniref:3-hydroxy-3-methylglutaryl coenzyme A reductase n=1 Tax=Ignelater luminosus TaxID=2038154 RepID=A0A8K0C3H0_IGNLU|nr:hypothetical protein ILUMI_26812 [Ignelater luminosus]
MPTRLFHAHGEFCATHPWELIMATLTLTTCMLTVEHQHLAPPPKPPPRDCAGCLYEAEYNAADVIVMTLIRCLAVLYSYYQFRILHRMGSKYILGIAGLFTVFSSFIFTSALVNFLQIEIPDLKDTLFFFLLLIDLSKAGKLAQFALSGSNQEVKSNIARGMSLLGPAMTLDTIVETLVIGVGTMSGVHRLEVLSYIACLSVIVNYVIFMTFYPACLSLILELSRITTTCDKNSVKRYLISATLTEEDQKSNPVVQRVKLIMSAGLVIVHIHSRWSFQENAINGNGQFDVKEISMNRTEDIVLRNYIMRWVTLSTDHIVVLMLLLALVAKFVLFDNKQELSEELHLQMVQENLRRNSMRNSFSDTTSYFHSCKFLLEEQDGDEEKQYEDKEIQTMAIPESTCNSEEDTTVKPARNLDECLKIYESQLGASELTDEEVILLVKHKHIPIHQLEKAVDNPERGVKIRRKIVGTLGNFSAAVENVPYRNYDYSKVMGACCENVIGYIPVPVGIVGPLHLDGRLVYVPMATTEGCLVASTNRGSRALLKHGITSRVVADGMTRGPVVRFPSVDEASEALAWIETPENFLLIKESFDSSSRFAKLKKIHVRMAARYLFVRFVATTGDAMGMNMLSKGTELSLKMVQNYFPNMQILSLSGNFCTDKKPAAVNWIEGRGKYVVCEAIVPSHIVTSILKTNVHALVDVNISKNMIGSAVAGSIGGFNAHAANLVTAIYIATGQDPAQNVVSSNCMTIMEPWGNHGEDLYISCTMPSIEIGTVGGGTVLPAQSSCLEVLGVKGPHSSCPGENANRLARIVCGTVLAGELSLMAALTAGHLVESHLKHNRSTVCLPNNVNSKAGGQ